MADFTDYDVIQQLVSDLISEGVGATVSDAVRETVNAVIELEADFQKENMVAGPIGLKEVTIAGLAKVLDLDLSTVRYRARRAIKDGYLHNLETKRGQPMRLAVGDLLPDAVKLLLTMAQLMESIKGVPGSQERA